MREAKKNGKAEGRDLALLEDRIAIGQGRRQIYGSQIGNDNDTKLYYILCQTKYTIKVQNLTLKT